MGDKFEEYEISPTRRFQPRGIEEEDYQVDRYRQRRSSRAIPESAVSRRNIMSNNDKFKERDFKMMGIWNQGEILSEKGEIQEVKSNAVLGLSLIKIHLAEQMINYLINHLQLRERNHQGTK